jgi:predicted peptidase
MKANHMMIFVSMLLFLIGCTRTNSSSALPPGQHPQTFEDATNKALRCQYLLFLPQGYQEKQKYWPTVLFLHGVGERGSDLNLVKKHSLPKIVEQQKNFPFIVISPQCPEDGWWTKEIDILKSLLDDVVARYNVDTQRIYLTGLSMGGFGTWALAAEYPEFFAAIAPICGGGDPSMADKLKDVPVWAFHGAKDKIVPVKKSQELVNAIKARGGNARLTVYPDADHDSWTATYDNSELYDWFLKHRKVEQTK